MILIVDDDPLVVSVLRGALHGYDIVVADDATSAASLVEQRSGWRSFVVDLCLPEGKDAGLDLLRSLRKAYSVVPAAIFTGRFEPRIAHAAAALDALTFYKAGGVAQIAAFVRATSATVTREAAVDLRAMISERASRVGLTRRESDILSSIVPTGTAAEYCARESISEHTYKTHVNRLMKKLSPVVGPCSSLREAALRLLSVDVRGPKVDD